MNRREALQRLLARLRSQLAAARRWKRPTRHLADRIHSVEGLLHDIDRREGAAVRGPKEGIGE